MAGKKKGGKGGKGKEPVCGEGKTTEAARSSGASDPQATGSKDASSAPVGQESAGQDCKGKKPVYGNITDAAAPQATGSTDSKANEASAKNAWHKPPFLDTASASSASTANQKEHKPSKSTKDTGKTTPAGTKRSGAARWSKSHATGSNDEKANGAAGPRSHSGKGPARKSLTSQDYGNSSTLAKDSGNARYAAGYVGSKGIDADDL